MRILVECNGMYLDVSMSLLKSFKSYFESYREHGSLQMRFSFELSGYEHLCVKLVDLFSNRNDI